MDDDLLVKQLRRSFVKKVEELITLREQLAQELEKQALIAMRSDEYNFNDTAVRAKTFLLAAEIVRGDYGRAR